jgi:hypothetical protein
VGVDTGSTGIWQGKLCGVNALSFLAIDLSMTADSFAANKHKMHNITKFVIFAFFVTIRLRLFTVR